MIKVLVVDDSALVRKLFGQVFATDADFTVEFARNGLEALARAKEFKPDVVTLDIHMPELDGLECLDRLMLERPCPVVMVSSLTSEGAETTLEALRLGAVDFIPKPTGPVSLHMTVFGPQLIEKVRAAAKVKIRATDRLQERVKHRINSGSERRRFSPRAAGRAAGLGVVLIGTSTGGPPALEAVLTALPASFPWPIVIAQHMPATFTGPLARRLDGICAVSVAEIERASTLEPGCAYIGRGDADVTLVMRDGMLSAMSVAPHRNYPWHPSTERLVTSALDVLPATQLIGVLMTGMGNDGAAAMTRLRQEGGRTIAESEETAVVWGMPGELVKADGADAILPLNEIAGHLLELVPHAAHS